MSQLSMMMIAPNSSGFDDKKLRKAASKDWNHTLRSVGKLANTVWCAAFCFYRRWESIEMVRRYAHLAPNHLTQHAKQIDAIFEEHVTNMSHPAEGSF